MSAVMLHVVYQVGLLQRRVWLLNKYLTSEKWLLPPFWAGFGGESADLKCVGDLSGCPRVKWWKMGVRVTNNLMCSCRPERKITSSISSSSSSFPISIVRGTGLHVCVWDKGVCPLFVLCGEVKIMIRTNTFAHIHCLNLLLRSN